LREGLQIYTHPCTPPAEGIMREELEWNRFFTSFRMTKKREPRLFFRAGIIRDSFIYYRTHVGFAAVADSPECNEDLQRIARPLAQLGDPPKNWNKPFDRLRVTKRRLPRSARNDEKPSNGGDLYYLFLTPYSLQLMTVDLRLFYYICTPKNLKPNRYVHEKNSRALRQRR